MKITKDLMRRSIIQLAMDGNKLAMVIKAINSLNIDVLKETFNVIGHPETQAFIKKITEETNLKLEAMKNYTNYDCQTISSVLDTLKEVQHITENYNESPV